MLTEHVPYPEVHARLTLLAEHDLRLCWNKLRVDSFKIPAFAIEMLFQISTNQS